jgi:hypothetical protein
MEAARPPQEASSRGFRRRPPAAGLRGPAVGGGPLMRGFGQRPTFIYNMTDTI